MTSAKRLFHSPAGGLSAGVLFILTACAQPVHSDEEAGVETAPASEMAEPQQAETSEPADPNSKASAEPARPYRNAGDGRALWPCASKTDH